MTRLAVPECSPHHVGMDGRDRTARAVAARRGELGMSQQELADAAGVDVKTIGNLESRGRWPIARTRARIESALGWKSGELARIRIADDGNGQVVISPRLQRMIDELTPDERDWVLAQLTGRGEGSAGREAG